MSWTQVLEIEDKIPLENMSKPVNQEIKLLLQEEAQNQLRNKKQNKKKNRGVSEMGKALNKWKGNLRLLKLIIKKRDFLEGIDFSTYAVNQMFQCLLEITIDMEWTILSMSMWSHLIDLSFHLSLSTCSYSQFLPLLLTDRILISLLTQNN